MAYVYPKLPAKKTLSLFRIAGNGLANCLFVYARAISIAKRYNLKIIAPTWFNITLGPYLRGQKDKRHYLDLMKSNDEISGIKKLWLLNTLKHVKEGDLFDPSDDVIIEVSGLGDYFSQIIQSHHMVAPYVLSHINENNLIQVEKFDFFRCAAVHVRLGDYPQEWRIPLSWYKEKIMAFHCEKPDHKFLLFSDGSDDELAELLNLPYVERVYFGSAIADIVAISKCTYLIGSDSTFSAWGAYIGQVPSVFYRLKSKPILIDNSQEIVEFESNVH